MLLLCLSLVTMCRDYDGFRVLQFCLDKAAKHEYCNFCKYENVNEYLKVTNNLKQFGKECWNKPSVPFGGKTYNKR